MWAENIWSQHGKSVENCVACVQKMCEAFSCGVELMLTSKAVMVSSIDRNAYQNMEINKIDCPGQCTLI